jgi:6-phosphogluconolactonase
MKFEIRIFKDLENLSRDAADLFIEQAANSIAERGRFLVALNGGNTPTRLFQLLATEYREKVDWSKTHIFWGDERCVPPDDPGSSYGQAGFVVEYVSIQTQTSHRVKYDPSTRSGSGCPVEASKEYSLTLRNFALPPLDFPRFDLVYLGMGEDGHTASLFPGSSVTATDPTMPVTAQYQDRPANRVTLTPVVFNSARTVAFMATGDRKAVTLAEVLSDRYNPELYPAQRINPKDGKLIWLVDEDAASQLPKELKARFCEG